MSQGFHQGIINFSNGFDRSATTLHRQDQQMAADQPSSSQRDINRFRVQGYEQQPTIAAAAPMGSLEEDQSSTSHHHHHQQIPVGYETGAGMLSEMFNYQSIPTTASTDMLEEQNQMSMNYRLLGRPGSSSAAAMQLFQMNPQQRSPSPPPPQHQHQQHLQGFHLSTAPAAEEVTFDGNPISVSQFMTWVPGNNSNVEAVNSSAATTSKIGGLSLSLSSLQHLEAAKQEEFRMGDGGFFYYNQQLENLGSHHHPPHQQQQHQHLQPLRLQGLGHGNLLSSTSQQHQLHGGFSSPSTVGVVNVLRNSKYMKPTQELLEEFCSVGSRGHHHLKNHKRHGRRNSNPNTNQVGGSGSGGGGDNIVGSSSSSKDVTPPLSAADRIEQQRKKVSLLSMLDEVDRRYNYYCEQMQMVVNTFDSVMGYGAATPYTTLAQKAMSGHFRCLKDAISTQLKQTSELLGDKEGTSGSGVTKGETPRLRILDQSLRQQRAFHQMGMMEQEAWRPQRGLPERSVTILRAWLFEHFLHPYPSDADKHLLARQTGLSRNQVSNWFINARVRLWKPMVEEMYQQESKEAEEMTATTATTDHDEREGSRDQYHQFHRVRNSNQQDYKKTTTNTTPPSQPTAAATTTAAEATVIAAAGMRSEIDALENDPSSSSSSLNAININCSSETTNNIYTTSSTFHNNNDMPPSSSILNNNLQQQRMLGNDTRRNLHSGAGGNNSLVTHEYGSTSSSVLNAQHENMESTLIRFGTASGDVSLTLGLRHAGNLPTENRFSVRDFRG
ncbi:hypothetical protein MKW94_016951 [Papaver nudicaule]|uniref:Homeobox domain-containing protein n=1 Tax=Papaver nudicaule TaxID=74823 RepID=A0AA42AWQ3_PAPNU|nr:hypothetical protein [Papaver nudicaule]